MSDNHDDEWGNTYANSAEDAAAKFAEDYDRNGGEYSIVSHGGADIDVRKPGEDAIRTFTVSAETVPEYSCYEEITKDQALLSQVRQED